MKGWHTARYLNVSCGGRDLEPCYLSMAMLTRLNTDTLCRNKSKKGHQEQNIVPRMRLEKCYEVPNQCKCKTDCWLPDILMAVTGMETAETRASDTARDTTWMLLGVCRETVRK